MQKRRTFSGASESSPVHGEIFQPRGNLRSPGNGGAAAWLNERTVSMTSGGKRDERAVEPQADIPAVNLLDGSVCFSLAVSGDTDVLNDRLDDVVLEDPFDELMQKVRREKFVYIGSWEVSRERLAVGIMLIYKPAHIGS